MSRVHAMAANAVTDRVATLKIPTMASWTMQTVQKETKVPRTNKCSRDDEASVHGDLESSSFCVATAAARNVVVYTAYARKDVV